MGRGSDEILYGSDVALPGTERLARAAVSRRRRRLAAWRSENLDGFIDLVHDMYEPDLHERIRTRLHNAYAPLFGIESIEVRIKHLDAGHFDVWWAVHGYDGEEESEMETSTLETIAPGEDFTTRLAEDLDDWEIDETVS